MMKLIKPNYRYKDKILKYKEEFLLANESLHGGAMISKYDDFSLWMENVIKCEETNPINNFVPSSTYILLDDFDNVIGFCNIRHYLNEHLLQTGGHIGYSIIPSKRCLGYGKIQLKLALEKAKELGIERVLVTCNDDNIASRKVIEANGGVYENEVYEYDKNNIVKRFWIDLIDVN